MKENEYNIYSQSNIEEEYKLRTNPKHRKKYGQIFTPLKIANFMTKWIITKISQGKLLDPALGLGIFFRQLLQLDSPFTHDLNYQLKGYELDPRLVKIIEEVFASLPLTLSCYSQDFLLADITEQFDGIICNPPYIHFQDYKQSLPLIKKFNEQYDLKLNGFSNIYSLFLIKSLNLLKPGGRAAFIIPSEFLNADYGVSIKNFFLKSKLLSHMIIFDPSFQVFEGFLTTSVILLFEHKKNDYLHFYNVKDMKELEEVEKHLLYNNSKIDLNPKIYTYDQLNPTIKWKHYYKDLKINLHLESKQNLIPFHKFAKVRRGIATGANDFFTFSKEKAIEYKISPKYLTPCLTRASQIQHHIFDQKEFQSLIDDNKKVFLLNLHHFNLDEIDNNLRNYIHYGEKQRYHTRYLTKNRYPWYSIEPLSSADLLVKTFSRDHVVFIQNNTPALNLTCFHGVYLNSLGNQYKNIIFLYLITDLAKEIFEGQKRDYCSGLGKFEPNDIKQAKVLDFTLIAPKDLAILNHLYQLYVQYEKTSTLKAAEIIQQIEKIFIKYW
ncbi:MAG: N-6 DNA methylase [Halanaerobiales bacterium]|nr:N-6 DNA methylase [Halanaerobiales bacterium]